MSFKILVLGESCVDQFQYGKVNRVCPEAPCVVFNPTYKTENLGMAANVVANLYALDDSLEIDFITNETLPLKIRYVEERSNQMLMRQDIGDAVKQWNGRWDETKPYDCVVVSDYCKGFLDEAALNMICACVSTLSFLDTKKPMGKFCINYSFVKINEHEYNATRNTIEQEFPYMDERLIITKGDRGATHNGVDYPTNTPEKIMDVSGAGDTFLAGLVYEYLKSRDIEMAIHFANRCASRVVTKRGVSTI